MPDMLIQQKEFSKWLSDKPHLVTPLLKGYKEAISDMGSDLLTDPRSSKNTHIMNPGFVTQQRYFMGFQYIGTSGCSRLIVSCLYVFSMFRRTGLGTHLVSTAKQLVQDKGYIQVAVEKQKIHQLDRFYRDQGFISTDDIFTNASGMAYRDYFWSGKPIALSRVGNLIAVQPQ